KETIRASLDATGFEAFGGPSLEPTISANGRYVAFSSRAWTLVPDDTDVAVDVFVKDLVTGAIERVSVASDRSQAVYEFESPLNGSRMPSISADGRFVAFVSNAVNFAPAADPRGSGRDRVFIHDRKTRVTEAVSNSLTGEAR